MRRAVKRAIVILIGFIVSSIQFVLLQMLLPWPLGLWLGSTIYAIIGAIFIFLAFFALKRRAKTEIDDDATIKALALLKERLAKGEITMAEYDDLFDKLTK